jgi:DNA mismatch repair protein MutS2
MNDPVTEAFRYDEHTADVLEFPRIRAEIADLALSPEGVEALQSQPFSTNPEEIFAIQEKVRYFLRLFNFDLLRPRYSFPGISGLIDLVRIEGSSLDAPHLIAIADYLRAARDFKRFAGSTPDEHLESPLITELGLIDDLPDLERFVRKHIDEDGKVREDLPGIAAILSRTREVRSTLHANARRHLLDKRDMWQTDVPTIKDERTVLPLKSDYRGSIKGIVREVSATGSTIYIETDDIMEGNNELSLLNHEYAIEVARILRECSARVREDVPGIRYLASSIGSLDSLYARARYGEVLHGITPERVGTSVTLIEARHPFLGSSVVPIDVQMADETRVLIITGPNAGGKTVTLKTIGLFSLLHQFGIPLPAKVGSELPIFDGVFADIGDEQSIDESLSTFSGHMKNVARFLQHATRHSLVLLDELGGGTDPEEGSAIAMAILDTLIERGCTVIVTTHHNVLKNYGYTHDAAVNASVSFDSDTHRPTYRIIMGLPGESHAFEIAGVSGIPEVVVAKAHNYLDERSTDVAALIRTMTEKERELERRSEEFDNRRTDLNEKQRDVDLHALRLRQHELELQTQGYRELTKQMDEYRSRLENLVKDLRKGGEIDHEKTKEVKEYIGEIQNVARLEKKKIDETSYDLRPVTDIHPGMEVYVGKSRQRGTVVRSAKKNSWVIETDRMRLTLPAHEILGIAEKQAPQKKVSIQHVTGGPPPALELDLRGKRLEEAIFDVDSQIDRCILSGIYEFDIIHGHGEGILKRGVRDHLDGNRAVKKYEFAQDTGKTIVKLSSR